MYTSYTAGEHTKWISHCVVITGGWHPLDKFPLPLFAGMDGPFSPTTRLGCPAFFPTRVAYYSVLVYGISPADLGTALPPYPQR